MTPLDIETNISELLIHTADFLNDPVAAGMDASDPLLYSIVAGFMSIISIYDDYKKVTTVEPFNFTKDIPSG